MNKWNSEPINPYQNEVLDEQRAQAERFRYLQEMKKKEPENSQMENMRLLRNYDAFSGAQSGGDYMDSIGAGETSGVDWGAASSGGPGSSGSSMIGKYVAPAAAMAALVEGGNKLNFGAGNQKKWYGRLFSDSNERKMEDVVKFWDWGQ